MKQISIQLQESLSIRNNIIFKYDNWLFINLKSVKITSHPDLIVKNVFAEITIEEAHNNSHSFINGESYSTNIGDNVHYYINKSSLSKYELNALSRTNA